MLIGKHTLGSQLIPPCLLGCFSSAFPLAPLILALLSASICLGFTDPFHYPFPDLWISVFLISRAVKESLLLRRRGPVALSGVGGLPGFKCISLPRRMCKPGSYSTAYLRERRREYWGDDVTR